MADNIQLEAVDDAGEKLATAVMSFSGDSCHFQICAGTILSGSEGSWTQTLIVGGAGVVTGGVQRVTLASDDPAVVDLAAIEVLLTAANVDHAANEVLLTTIAGDTTSLDGKITACDTGAVVIASGVITSITNAVTVTGTFWQTTQPVSAAALPLPSGAATEATLAAIAGYLDTEVAALVTAAQLLDNCISGNEAQVDVVSCALPTGAATSALQGGGLPAALGVGGGLKVDGSGTALPVSGTFWQTTQPISAASLPLPTGAALDSTLSTLSGKVTACNTGAVVISSGSCVVTNGGTFAVQVDGNALTALQLIDDTVATLGTTTYTEASTKGNVVGAVRNDDLATLANTDNEIAPLQVDPNGALYVNQAAAEIKQVSGVAAGGTPGADAMVGAVVGKKLLVLAMALFATSATANNIYVDNEDNNLLFNSGNPLPLSLDADGDTVPAFILPFNPGGWFKTDTANEAITLNTSAAQDIAYCVTYIETD